MPKNVLLERAAHTKPMATKRGMLERLFTMMFQGFVYNQIWEDPAIDLEAMRVGPEHTIVTIASAGCNVMNYLAADPKKIIAVDLNPNHVALTRLKLAALKELPYEEFFRFFGVAKSKENRRVFDSFLADRLDPATRDYWERRMPLYGRRINMFARDLYRHGLLGRFIGTLHTLAKLQGKKLTEILDAQSVEEQRAIFDRQIAPLFDTKLVRALSKMPIAYYGLGIPPNQYDELVASAADGNPAAVLRERVAKLACDFPLKENYFAWQAFGRGYDTMNREAVPPYLRPDIHAVISKRTDRVEVHHASMIDFLRDRPAGSVDRFVLLDAQDWMTADVITALWTQINHAASADARVIFRTAGPDSPLEKKLPAEILAPWQYHAEESADFHRRDRSSIYGGFHVYSRKPA